MIGWTLALTRSALPVQPAMCRPMPRQMLTLHETQPMLLVCLEMLSPRPWPSYGGWVPATVACYGGSGGARARGLVTAAFRSPRLWPHNGGISEPAAVAP